nr:MAG: hypothetical protein DIU56_12330 [Pseudomonadota bacterium]
MALAAALLSASLAAATAVGAENGSDERPSEQEVEARLRDAQKRLEDAAREIAALSAEMTRPFMDQFWMYLPGSRRAIIGVQLDPQSGREGARVKEVSPGGPAAQAGIRPGDVIVAIDGRDITGEAAAREVLKRMREVEPDSKVRLRVLRDGKPREFEVIARAPDMPKMPGFDPEAFESFQFFHGAGTLFAGMELATLTPGLGRYFGTEKGVLVIRAPKNDALQLQDGDVILAIDGREPQNGTHATRILRSYQPGEKLTLKLMRDRKPLTLEVTVPQQDTEGRRVITWRSAGASA